MHATEVSDERFAVWAPVSGPVSGNDDVVIKFGPKYLVQKFKFGFGFARCCTIHSYGVEWRPTRIVRFALTNKSFDTIVFPCDGRIAITVGQSRGKPRRQFLRVEMTHQDIV